MKKNQISRLFAIFVLSLSLCFYSLELAAQGQTVQTTPNAPCPCSALYPGYYYTGQYYPYKPVLFSNMPLDLFVGYVIMDSIITHVIDSKRQADFIKSLTCGGDTLSYALKYLYRMADYNPFLYYNFMTSYQAGKAQPMTLLSPLLKQVKKECGLMKHEIIMANYILHLRTNAVEQFTYESQPGDKTNLIYVYSQVIDTIKGQVLPDINNAITVFMQDSAGRSVKKAAPLYASDGTNFIFYFNKGWTVGNDKIEKNLHIEANKEYIVFSWIMGACINSANGQQFYEIRPTATGLSGGIYPIINGDVIDEDNDFGWGASVPLDKFKNNLQELIHSINHYGE